MEFETAAINFEYDSLKNLRRDAIDVRQRHSSEIIAKGFYQYGF